MKPAPFTSILLGALLQLGGLSILSAATALTAEQMQTLLRSRPETDEIRWKDAARGAPLKVRIVNASPQGVIVEKQLPAGLTSRTIPLAELAGIEFTFSPREFSLHQMPDPASVPALRILWEARLATIRIPGTNVSETGLALAKSLRLTGGPAAFEEAGKILGRIISDELIAFRKDQARGEQATIDFVLSMQRGRPEETDKLAWTITEESSAANPDAMLLATAYLADRHFSQLKTTEENNPRWIEDDEVKPVRERLYNLALDFALYPSLFQASRPAEAAAGLMKAADIYQYTNENGPLKGTLEDLAALYPESAEAKGTTQLLARLKQAEAAGKLAEVKAAAAEKKKEPSTEEEENQETPTGAPPPPKRYNIFGD